MSNKNTAGTFLLAIKTVVVSCLKILAIIVGWVCTCIGFIFSKIGSLALKLAEK